MMVVAVRRYHRTEAEGASGHEEPLEALATHEREASAAGVFKLEHEAEMLVHAWVELDGEGDGWRPFRLVLEIEPGWHLQANPASEAFLVPTELAAEGAELRNVRYPPGEPWQPGFVHQPIAVYGGQAELTGEAKGKGRLLLTYQACDESRCLPPVTREVEIG
jgi:hypothetical protein